MPSTVQNGPIGDSMFENLKVFWGEARSEFRKISWPTREEAQGSTIVVFTTVIFVLVTLFVFDWVITEMMSLVIK
jgi:preprotein translocase subunit SecE